MPAPGSPPLRPPSDEADRDVARFDLDRSHVVEAGAGTGKTSILVDRVLALVRSGRATLDRIVAITFTEKAAGELKVRLRDALEAAFAAETGKTERERLARAIGDLERAAIETIHAFCARLLRDRPVEAGVDPRFDTLDELRADLLFEETWAAWLEDTLGQGPEALKRAWAAGIGPRAWESLATQLVAARANRAAATAPAEPPALDVRPVLAAAGFRVAGLHKKLAAAARDTGDHLLVELEALGSELIAWRDSDALEATAYLLRDLRLPAVSSGNKTKYRSKEVLERVREELAEVVAALEAERQAAAESLLQALLACLEGFVARHESVKRERGQLDFDDLLLLARDLLRSHGEVRRDFSRRFQFLLVDEFQDTDPLQAEIVFLLCDERGEARSWREVEVPPGKLFLVGDPKQSIYRFRRADVELYEQAKACLLGGREPVTIRENFRSDAGLIEWVNAVFTGEMTRPDTGAWQPEYRPLTPYHTGVRGDRAIVTLVPEPGTLAAGARVAEQRALEAAAIAGLIRRAREEKWAVRGRDGEARDLGWGDVALLLRAMPDIEIYEEALRLAEVPYRITGGKDYYRRAEVQALLRLLEAVDDPADEIAVVAALRSPFLGVPDDVLLAHRQAGRRFDYLARAPGAAPEIADSFALLHELHAERNRLDPASLISLALTRTRGAALVSLKPHGEQRVANLLKLADEASALAEAGLGTLRAVVRHLADLESRDIDESESPLAEDGDDAVRVMTVHKAKGLEFPCVILADLGRTSPNDRPQLLVERAAGRLEARVKLRDTRDRWAETAGFAPAWDREKERLEAEQLRLLYVGLTRAKDLLVLPLFAAREAGAALKPPFLRALAGHLPGLGDPELLGLAERVTVIGAETLPKPSERGVFRRAIDLGDVDGAAPRARLEARRAWQAERQRALARAGRGLVLIHPSDLTPAGEHEARSGSTPAAAVRVGIAVHAALERADLGDAGAARRAAREEARAAGLEAQAAARVERLVTAALDAPVAAAARAAPACAREVPFSVWIGGTRVEGQADFVYRAPAGLVVADWKTDAAARGGAPAVARLAEHYRPQALLYALAVEQASGERVSEVVLVFLDGAAGAPVEVRIPFDAATRAEARRCIGASGGEPVNLPLFLVR